MKQPSTGRVPGTSTRRRFLQNAGSLAFAAPLVREAVGLGGYGGVATPVFEEVPASRSGITWVHTAGKSAKKYLPETSGAGCAFLDFDNDGWMDIYLVNSGGPISTRRRIRCEMRSIATIATEHLLTSRRSRCWGAAGTEWAWRWATTTATAFPIST